MNDVNRKGLTYLANCQLNFILQNPKKITNSILFLILDSYLVCTIINLKHSEYLFIGENIGNKLRFSPIVAFIAGCILNRATHCKPLFKRLLPLLPLLPSLLLFPTKNSFFNCINSNRCATTGNTNGFSILACVVL